jgi:hypothetical protein
MKTFIETLKQRRPSLEEVKWQFHEPDPARNSVFATRGTPRAKLVHAELIFIDYCFRVSSEHNICVFKVLRARDGSVQYPLGRLNITAHS